MPIRYLSGVNVDSNTLVVDAANDSVGIGTGSPSSALHISRASAVFQITDTNKTANNSLWIQALSQTSWGIGTADNSASGTKITIADSGNVGIGTTAPASKLQVGGAAKITGGDWPTANAGLELNYVTNTAYVGSYDRTNSVYKKLFLFSEDLTLETGAVTRMFITNGGNVLIGTTTDPGYKLTVAGDILASASSGNRSVVLTTNNANAALNVIAGSGLELASDGTNKQLAFRTGVTTAMAILSTAAIRFNQYGSGTFTGTPAYNLGVDASGNVIELPGGVVDGSGTANYVSKWSDANTLTDSVIYDNGTSVGVGTTTPNPFSWATKTITIVSSASNSYAALEAYGNGTGAGALLLGNTSILRASIVAEDGSNLLFATNAGNTGSSQSERMRITAAGNVGIGTTSPGEKLDIQNGTSDPSIRLRGRSSDSAAAIRFTTNDGVTERGRIVSFDTYLEFGFGGSERMRITSAGNVGIGTTSPGAKLTVYTGGASSISGTNDGIRLQVSSYNNSARNTIAWHQDGSDLNLGRFGLEWNSGTSQMNFVWRDVYNSGVGVSELMRLQGNGNLGIGTTSPAVRLSGRVLSLNDTSVNLQSSIELLRNGNSSGEIFVNSDNMVIGSYETGIPLVFRTQNNEHLRITSGGNVGIGTTSPAQKLDVNGTIRAGIAGNSSANIPALLVTSSGTGDAQAAIAIQQATSEGDTIIFADYEPYVEWGISTENAANKIQFTAGTSTGSLGSKTLYNNAGDARTAYIKFDHDLASGQTLIGGNVGIGTTAPKSKLQIIGPTLTTNNENSYAVWVSDTGDDTKGLLLGYDLVNDVGVIQAVDQATSWKNISIASNGGNVSIGTTTNSGARTNIFLSEAGATPNAILRLQNTGSQYLAKMILTDGTTNDAVIGYQGGVTSATQYLGFGIGTSITQMILNASGNVGIGTTAPTMYGGRGMEVSGAGQTGIRISDTAGGGKVEIGSDSSGGYIQTAVAGNALTFYTGNASTLVMRMTSAGNVGIGTTAPTYGLVVANQSTANSATGTMYIGAVLNGSGKGLVIDSATRTTSDNAVLALEIINRAGGNTMAATVAGNVGIGTTSPNATLEVDGSFNVRNGNGDVTHFNYIDGSTNYVRGVTYFDTNSAYFTGGNVGIGTTAPIRKLSILDVGSSFQLRIGYSNDYYYDIGRDPNDGYFDFYGNQTGFIGYRFGGVDGTRLSITPAGNVGIGTTAPTSKLYIEGGSADWNETTPGLSVGTIHLDPGTGTNDYGNAITFGASDAGGGTNAQAGIYLRSDGNYGTKMYFATTDSYAAGSKTRMFIGHDGNVGIGTAGPNYKLEVSGTGFFGGVLRASVANTFPIRAIATSGGVSRISFEDNVNQANDAVWVGSEGYNLCFGSSFSEQARISSSGNLIIGSTTDAGYKLDVHGEILGRDDIRILNTYALILNGTDANWRIGRNTITDTGWLTGNTMQMVVFGGQTGQGFQVVNHNGTALFEIDGVAGASRFTNALGVGVNPSGTAGRIDASNDIVAYSTSDLRLKENIKPIENALDKVKALTGVEFDWKEDTKAVHGYEGHDVGVIAQEVQAVLPEAVRTNDSGYLSVRYEKMIALLVEANKELASRVEELEKKLK